MGLITRWLARASKRTTDDLPAAVAPHAVDVAALREQLADQALGIAQTSGTQAARDWVNAQRDADASDDHQAACHVALARLALREHDTRTARAELQQAIGLCSSPGLLHHELAHVHIAGHDLLAAQDSLQLASVLMPGDAQVWFDLGQVLLRLDCDDEAVSALATADDLISRFGEPLPTLALQTADKLPLALSCKLALANALMGTAQHEAAARTLRRALQMSPDNANILVRLANVELLFENDQVAADLYQRAVDTQVEVAPEVRLNFGFAKTYLGRWEEAREDFEKVLAAQPAHHIARWYLCQNDLAMCRWAAGWANYGVRHAVSAVHIRYLPFRPWQGDRLEKGVLLILAEEGIGDEVLFSSCYQQAIERVGTCIIECEQRLASLFRRSFPGAIVVGKERSEDISWLDNLPTPTHQVLCGDLPRYFRTSVADFAAPTPYLVADAAEIEYWRQRLASEFGHGLKVGISWRGGTVRTRGRARSLPIAEWAPILAVPGVTFVSLQYGDVSTDLAQFEACHGITIHHHKEAHFDYDRTAALVGSLDLVISVCTAVIHLGGALGQEVWVLTPFSASWRYTAHEVRMPWYPAVRLFRKTALDDWAPVCTELAAALKEMTNSVTTHPAL